MTDKPEQGAEEIVGLIISNTASQYDEMWKPDIVYTKEDLIKIVQSYANQEVKKACEENKNYLTDQLEIYRKLMDNDSKKSEFAKGKHRGFFFAYKSELDRIDPL